MRYTRGEVCFTTYSIDGSMREDLHLTRPDAHIHAYKLLDKGVTDEVVITHKEVITRGEAHAQDSGRAQDQTAPSESDGC